MWLKGWRRLNSCVVVVVPPYQVVRHHLILGSSYVSSSQAACICSMYVPSMCVLERGKTSTIYVVVGQKGISSILLLICIALCSRYSKKCVSSKFEKILQFSNTVGSEKIYLRHRVELHRLSYLKDSEQFLCVCQDNRADHPDILAHKKYQLSCR